MQRPGAHIGGKNSEVEKGRLDDKDRDYQLPSLQPERMGILALSPFFNSLLTHPIFCI